MDPAMEQVGSICAYNPAAPPWTFLNDADLNLYHIGNNSEFHTEILEMSRLHPGILVLHDLRLHDLVWATYVDRTRDFSSYLDAMERWYGEDGVRAARDFIDGGNRHREVADEMAQQYPLTREIINGALGVVTHSAEALENMREVPDCPTAALSFPHAALAGDTYERAAAARQKHRAPYTILLFGYINRNRRLVPILEAIAAMPEKDRFRVEICGELWDKNAIKAAIERFDLGGIVKLRGHLPDEDIPRIMAESDIALNLRHPTMGEASLSQMEFWDYGLPSLVTRTGWYASLPRDAVCFVDPACEIKDIQEHLRQFLADPARFYRMGKAGREALHNHHPREYAAHLVEFAAQATAKAHRTAGIRLATRTGVEIRKWLHPDMSEHILKKVSSEISDIFFGPKSGSQSKFRT